ncbi:MAG TPA: TlpA disulfide reductase family protein [Candidatus Hydrogenedentes bacterium]|nr:TlpA disulfide reductase family protein [Candidatus Hydrogenedentota bacterium]
MRKFAILVHVIGVVLAVTANAALGYLFLTSGKGSFLSGTLRASTERYYFPGIAMALAVAVGIPVLFLSGLRLLQLLFPNSGLLSRRTWVRPSSNTLLAVVLLAFLAHLPDNDLLMDPVKRVVRHVTRDSFSDVPKMDLRSDAEMEFPELPYVAGPDPLTTLELKGMDGTIVKLADLKGKAVFLNFWATGCVPCRAEMPNLANLYAQVKQEPAVAFALISYESPEKVKAFLEKYPHDVPVYTISEEMLKRLKISGFPTTMILSKTGEKIFSKVGAVAWDAGTTKEFLLSLAGDLPFHPPSTSGN